MPKETYVDLMVVKSKERKFRHVITPREEAHKIVQAGVEAGPDGSVNIDMDLVNPDGSKETYTAQDAWALIYRPET